MNENNNDALVNDASNVQGIDGSLPLNGGEEIGSENSRKNETEKLSEVPCEEKTEDIAEYAFRWEYSEELATRCALLSNR